jgi:GNAT superfamily N-acetyltransferase
MRDNEITAGLPGDGVVRMLNRQEMPLLREHLLRLDPDSRRDRFNGWADERFIERYADKCRNDGTVIIAYVENGRVTAAAELHPPEAEPDSLPEVAFSVERHLRRKGLGSILFKRLIEEAQARGYQRLRITTGAQNEAMRALAHKFGANLTFRYGESTGVIALDRPASCPSIAA